MTAFHARTNPDSQLAILIVVFAGKIKVFHHVFVPGNQTVTKCHVHILDYLSSLGVKWIFYHPTKSTHTHMHTYTCAHTYTYTRAHTYTYMIHTKYVMAYF